MHQHKNTAFMLPEVNAENVSLVLFTKAQTIVICMHKTLCSCIEVLQLNTPLQNLPGKESSLYLHEQADIKKQMLRMLQKSTDILFLLPGSTYNPKL